MADDFKAYCRERREECRIARGSLHYLKAISLSIMFTVILSALAWAWRNDRAVIQTQAVVDAHSTSIKELREMIAAMPSEIRTVVRQELERSDSR